MFDVLLRELATRLKLGDKAGPLLTMLLSLIFNEKKGGFAGFIDRFRSNGMGDLLTSWLGNGENRSLSLSQLETALGSNVMQQMASRLDLSSGTISTALGQLIPTVIDKLSPDGRLPTGLSIPDTIAPYLTGEHAKFSQIAVLPEVQAAQAAAHSIAHAHTPSKPNWLWLALIPVLCAPLFFMRGCDTAPVGPAKSTVTIGPEKPAGTRVITSEPIPESVEAAKVHSDGLETGTEAPTGDNTTATSATPADPNAAATSAFEALVTGEFTVAQLTDALNLMGVKFDNGKSTIKADSLEILKRAAEAIKKAPSDVKLEVAGHTDNRGQEERNMTLSQARADAVIAKLVELGVKAEQLTGKGYGSSTPRASNDEAPGRALNRRIEFSVL